MGEFCKPKARIQTAPYSALRLKIWVFSVAFCCGCVALAEEEPVNLGDLSLEELMEVEVTSLSKKPQSQFGAGAAIFVVTNSDIRRSGATSIPEVLRMVPGVNVGRLDANKYSLSIRGFGSRFTDKLLVLIDGRSVYTPTFSGIVWESIDVLLEDVDRIEVIRGPGGTLWGANAVNGIINIITKSPKDTQGGLLVAGGGNEEQSFGAFRYGWHTEEKAFYRVYAKYFDRDDQELANGQRANDSWNMVQGGFRVDWRPSDEDQFSFIGNLHSTEVTETLNIPSFLIPLVRPRDEEAKYVGWDFQVEWRRTISEDSSLQLKLYYDRFHSKTFITSEDRETIDLDFQHQFRAGTRHEFIWGAGFRYWEDHFAESPDGISPNSRSLSLYTAFIQDDITLIDEKLHLTVGSKFEHNEYSGFEYQPSIRLTWTPNNRHTVWGAVTRAVRTPARVENDLALPVQAPLPGVLAVIFGKTNFGSESVISYEAGYRVKIAESATLDMTVFYNDYDDMRTAEVGLPFLSISPLPLHLVVPLFAMNNLEARTYGFELALDWRPKPWWRLRATYSWLNMDLDLNAATVDPITGFFEGSSPEQQATVHSGFDIPGNVELDLIFRYVDSLATLDVDSYVTADVRIAWKPTEGLEVSLVGQNLLEGQRRESAPIFISSEASEVERGFYGKLEWRF